MQGTPTFFVNGKRVIGAQPIDVMERLVQQAQAAAAASGYSRADYYEKVILGR